jgi:hypothetical protein
LVLLAAVDRAIREKSGSAAVAIASADPEMAAARTVIRTRA